MYYQSLQDHRLRAVVGWGLQGPGLKQLNLLLAQTRSLTLDEKTDGTYGRSCEKPYHTLHAKYLRIYYISFLDYLNARYTM